MRQGIQKKRCVSYYRRSFKIGPKLFPPLEPPLRTISYHYKYFLTYKKNSS